MTGVHVALFIMSLPLIALITYDFVLLRNIGILLPTPNNWWFFAVGTWVLAAIFAYVLLRIIARCGLKSNRKTLQQEKRDLLFFFYVNIAFAMVGGIALRLSRSFTSATLDGILYVPIYISYLALYTALFEFTHHEEFTLTPVALSTKPIMIVLVVTMAMLIVALLLFSAWYSHIFEGYITIVALLLVIHACFLFDPHVHVHHWSYPIPFIFLCIFDTYSSFIIQIAALAVHTHGVAMFGVQDIFRGGGS